MSFQAIMDQEQSGYNGNEPETGGNDRNMSTHQMGDVTSSSGTVNVRSVRYLDDILLVSDDKSNFPTQEEINLNNKN